MIHPSILTLIHLSSIHSSTYPPCTKTEVLPR
jgi:hypothetical protein